MTLLAGALIETQRFEEARTLAADAKKIYLKALGRAALAHRQRRQRGGCSPCGPEAVRAG